MPIKRSNNKSKQEILSFSSAVWAKTIKFGVYAYFFAKLPLVSKIMGFLWLQNKLSALNLTEILYFHTV